MATIMHTEANAHTGDDKHSSASELKEKRLIFLAI
jgi:hypothetical protein